MLLLVCVVAWGCDDPPAPSASSTTSSTVASTVAATPPPSATESAAPIADGPEQAEVRKLLEAYKAAIYANDGPAAAALASKRTLDYFDEARKLALYASRAELKEKPLFDQMMVLILRARLPVADVEASDGKTLFARGVSEGWTGAVARNFDAGPIAIDGDTAVIMSQPKPWLKGEQDKGFRAYREDGHWKLDVISVASLAVVRMDAQLAKLDPDPQVALVKLTETLLRKKLPADIWDAPRKASPAGATGGAVRKSTGQ